MHKKKPANNTPCQACGGSGQLNLFGGESRFLLTTEECPHCSGFGFFMPDEPKGERKKKGKK